MPWYQCRPRGAETLDQTIFAQANSENRACWYRTCQDGLQSNRRTLLHVSVHSMGYAFGSADLPLLQRLCCAIEFCADVSSGGISDSGNIRTFRNDAIPASMGPRSQGGIQSIKWLSPGTYRTIDFSQM